MNHKIYQPGVAQGYFSKGLTPKAHLSFQTSAAPSFVVLFGISGDGFATPINADIALFWFNLARHLQDLDNARRAVSLDQAGQIRLLDAGVKAADGMLEKERATFRKLSQDLASQTKTSQDALAKSQKEVAALKKDG
ncbi:hypothetical protein BDY24DRAFT_418910 [Mrakia frigida]|uniref:uncharacterized protein n=1 Tax=Mrakia frigida TaxID=29902 RepID=UPI003FCBF2C5